jgi:uncharacterized protein DUF932
MSGTLLHSRSQLVTREELLAVPPPSGTATWRPIAHGDLVLAIERQLTARGIGIRKEAFAIQREGARLFAVLDLSLESNEEFSAALGVRTANDRSMALEIAVGVRVLVCDNLAFSGDLIALRRRHTARFELDADIARAAGRYESHLLALQRAVASIKENVITADEAKALLFEIFRREILPLRHFRRVADLYLHPTAETPDVLPRTLWGLHNACSRVVKDLVPAAAFEATVELGRFFNLSGKPAE